MGEWSRASERTGSASPAAVWERLIDGRKWHEWHAGVTWTTFESGLEPGGYLTIKPLQGPQTAFRIVEARGPRALAFETRLGPLGSLAFRYAIDAHGDGSRARVRLVIRGVAARALVRLAGERIAASLDGNLERLLARAGSS